MRTITLDNFKSALQNAANQKGAAGVAHIKSVMLEGCIVTDADGNPLPPEAIDIHIMPTSAPEGVAMDSAPEGDAKATDIAKAVRNEIRTAIADSGIAVRKGITMPADDFMPRTFGKVKSFADTREAYRFGRFLFAAAGNAKSALWCEKNGMNLKAHSEGVNSAGGFLVPDEFEATLINLREKYGVMRANAKVFPMSRDTLNIPRRTAGLSGYWTGEASAATESTLTLSNVSLAAKKLSVITTTTSELAEDSLISIADIVADEIAWEFARKEDDAGFNGDGSVTYGGIVGLKSALLAGSVSDTGIGTAAVSGVTLAMVTTWLAKMPAYAVTANTKIYCHKSIYHGIFERLAMNSGGATASEFRDGIQPRFFGYPVVFVQAMDGTIGTGTNDVPLAYIGDMSMGVTFGDRRQITIRTSDSALNAFEQDELAIRGSQRVDIVVHGTGDATNGGPIISLIR